MKKKNRKGRKQAIALRYKRDQDAAPSIVASGKGEVADRILAIAEANDVPVKEEDGLVEALGNLEVGREIPPEMYRAVAEVLAFVYRLDQKARKSI